MSLVTDHIDLIKPEEYGLCLLYAFRRYRVGILQGRVDHDHTDDCAQIGIGPERFCRRERDQYLEECISRVAEQICKYIDGTARVHVNKSIVDHEVQGVHDPHEETTRHDGRDDRYKDIPQKLDRPHKYVLLLCRRLFCLGLGACRDPCDRDKLIEHLIDSPCSQDDLKLSGCLKYSLHSLNIFYGCLVSLAVIRNVKTEPGCTVCGGDDILTSANLIQNFLCGLSVVHNNSPFLLQNL